ncbi:hypothetical protein A6V36_34070 [Paraburkholderia ginsengiterrae]|uniref:Uncharacterized protein n=1 Tax=Paraburkholderia ginsengiterrae TaxID=1462993 RepID=A0ABX2UQK1_9BURK|nr:hypothetical protein A6V36_34070 [Paraburkholderia ginsengiterrae]
MEFAYGLVRYYLGICALRELFRSLQRLYLVEWSPGRWKLPGAQAFASSRLAGRRVANPFSCGRRG